MSAEELFSSILSSTYTTADFHRRLSLLRRYFEEKFFSGSATFSLEDYLNGNEIEQSDVQFLRSLSEDFYSSFTKDNAYSLIESVERDAKNAPKIIVYVSFQMPPGEVVKLGAWFKQNLPTNVLIDLKIDLAAFGGCMFVWNGYLSDYSLRYLLEEHKQEIGSLISSFGSKDNPANTTNPTNPTNATNTTNNTNIPAGPTDQESPHPDKGAGAAGTN